MLATKFCSPKIACSSFNYLIDFSRCIKDTYCNKNPASVNESDRGRVRIHIPIRHGIDGAAIGEKYTMTDSFLDGFGASFTNKGCILAEKHYPLGYFTVEYLEWIGRFCENLKG